MSISAQQVSELRKRTGVSMMQCKRALEESNGDEEKAIDVLRKLGMAKAAKKSDRVMSEGVIVTNVSDNKASIVKLTCETDFVAKNDEFQQIAKEAAKKALEDGAQSAIDASKQAIKDLFTKLGENMSVEVDVVEGKGIADYVHSNSKIGVIVLLDSPDAEKAKSVAMHIAAMNPSVINPEDVSDDEVAKEKEIWSDQLSAEGKPADILDKNMEGKEKKYRHEHALIKQQFVMDNDQTVEQYLSGSSVVQFKRFSI